MTGLMERLHSDGPLAQRPLRLVAGLAGREFEVWVVRAAGADLAARAGNMAEWLTERELELAGGFRFQPRREAFLLGRLAAKAALGALCGEKDWGRIKVGAGVFGQPLAAHAGQGGVETSLSHSGREAVALAFPREFPMGVDWEVVDAARAQTARTEGGLSAEERAWAGSGELAEAPALVMLWTLREALAKTLRCGITCPLEFLGADRVERLAERAWEARYRSFHQYKALSWAGRGRVLSVTLPRAAELRIG